MERQLILRNAVLSAEVSPSDFDVRAFERALDLGEREDHMVVDQVFVAEWVNVRLQILPERVQFGFKEQADSPFVREALAEFLRRIEAVAADKPLGFNAALELTLDQGDSDPSGGVFDADRVAGMVGGTRGRGGMSLVYYDDAGSRWWVELSPKPDDDRKWMFDFNRHFDRVPDDGPDREALLDWFADLETGINAQFETICLGADSQ